MRLTGLWKEWLAGVVKARETARQRQHEISAFARIVERHGDHLLRDVGISRDDGRDILERSKIPGQW